MERAGLIERKADPSDARSSKIHLTKRALRLSEPAQEVLRTGRRILQEEIGERDLKAVEQILDRMVKNMEQALQTDHPDSP